MLFPEHGFEIPTLWVRWIHVTTTLDADGHVAAVEVTGRTAKADLAMSRGFFPYGAATGHPEPLRATLAFALELVGQHRLPESS